MFETALNIHNPNDKRTHSVLRFFSEDLTENEKIEFVKSIFNRGSWTLSSEISRSSKSIKLAEETKNIFKEILDTWVRKRIEHSNDKLTSETKNPYVPKKYSYEFREAIIAVKDLDFHSELMVLIEEFLNDCYTNYLDKFLNSSFWLIIDDFSSNELETFFKYFSNIYIKSSSGNIRYFLYVFLLNLAYSPKIFSLSEDFLQHLNQLSKKLKTEDNGSDFSCLIAILLIDFINYKELDLSKREYVEIILPTIDNLERGNLDNLEFLRFLKKFNYQFIGYIFNEEIYSSLYGIEVNLSKIDEGDETTKKAILHHFIKSSEEYLELLIFQLEFLEKEKRIVEFEKFIKLIDRLRASFIKIMWFHEYDNFVPINGKIEKAMPDGFGVRLDSSYVNRHLYGKQLLETQKIEFIEQNLFGFANKRTFKKNSDINKYHSYLEQNKKNNSYQNSSLDSISKINLFHIWSVNYSSSNKGSVINLMPFSEGIYDLINGFQIKSFFSCVDLFLANEAFNLLKVVSPFGTRQYSPVLGRLLPSILKPSIKLEFEEDIFWDFLREYRPNIYEETYVKINKEIGLFNELIDIYEKDAIVQGTIQSRTKGGFFVSIKGQKTFLPGSQIQKFGITDYDSFVNQTMDFKIVKIDYENKNAVISHLKVNEEERIKQKDLLASELKKGLVLSGTVKNITSYGVFVDLGGMDGLIYINDLSWSRINHPSDIVKLHEEIDVVVLGFDLQKNKIDLGLKQLNEHPWDSINSKVYKGGIVEGKISKLLNAGAVIEILPGVEGLVHISKISDKQYSQLKVDDDVKVKVLSIDSSKRRLRFRFSNTNRSSTLQNDFLAFTKTVRVGDIFDGIVIKKNKGTGIVEIEPGKDIVAICPSRHMKKKNGALASVNDKMKFKLIEIDKRRARLIVSHSATCNHNY